MARNAILLLLVGIGSALAWFPLILEPTLDLPAWIPLAVIALSAGLATILSEGRWLRFFLVCSAASLAGLVVGYSVWPMEDGIAQSYAGIAIVVATLAVALVSLVAGLIGRMIPLEKRKPRGAAWVVLAGCIAFGPVALALRPALIAHRVEHNDRLAAQRFQALKRSVELTRAEEAKPGNICDGMALKRNYAGPAFSDRDWRYIAGNYVQEDGYIFGISVDCSKPGTYSIDVRPKRERADGTRRFCSDQSGMVGCGLDWSGRGESCLPCTK